MKIEEANDGSCRSGFFRPHWIENNLDVLEKGVVKPISHVKIAK